MIVKKPKKKCVHLRFVGQDHGHSYIDGQTKIVRCALVATTQHKIKIDMWNKEEEAPLFGILFVF